MEAAVGAGRKQFGPVSVVVANAAIDAVAPISEIEPSRFDRVVEVILGTFRTIRAALPHVRAERGHILLINSLGSVVPPPFQAAYAASKAGVAAFADSLRIELRGSGATVGQLYFSAVDTEHFRTGMAHPLMQRAHRRIPKSFTKGRPAGGGCRRDSTGAGAANAARRLSPLQRSAAVAPQVIRPLLERRLSS